MAVCLGRELQLNSVNQWTGGFLSEEREHHPIVMILYFYSEGEYNEKLRHDYWHVITLCYGETDAGAISRRGLGKFEEP